MGPQCGKVFSLQSPAGYSSGNTEEAYRFLLGVSSLTDLPHSTLNAAPLLGPQAQEIK